MSTVAMCHGSENICVIVEYLTPVVSPVMLPKPDPAMLSIADAGLTLPIDLSLPMTH